VTRANQSIGEFGPIFEALGMTGGTDIAQIKASMDARCDAGEAGAKQREALRQAIAFKKYEFDAHGVEMNQRYTSDAIVTDGQPEPPFKTDKELHYQPTTWPGARLPHVWVFDGDTGGEGSTLDLCGKGAFTLLTGIGGEAWEAAVKEISDHFKLPITFRLIGPRQAFVDHTGDWARIREVEDGGCLLVRPDHHVAWRSTTLTGEPSKDLMRVMTQILGRT